MLTIKCSECGEKVMVRLQEVGLWKRADGCNVLRFTCPACGRGIGVCLGADGVERLRSEGVMGIDVPAEALEEHDGPALTLDDLIDLHFLLESDGWETWIAQTTNRRRMRRLARATGKTPNGGGAATGSER